MNGLIRFDNLKKVLAEYADDFVYKYKENLSKSDRRATGSLITSVHSRIDVDGNEFAIDLNLEDYWKYVEEGRGPGKFPPIGKILEWVRVKPILPYPDKNGRLPTENQLAFLIGRKIANEGFEGSHDLEATFDETEYWEQRIADALDTDVMDCIDEIMLVFGSR